MTFVDHQVLYMSTSQEEKELCGQIVEHRRIQELQVMLESRECRPVSVHEWALAAGYPSSHQLLGALQDGRKAERNILICHHALVRSVAHRCVLVPHKSSRCS